MATANPTPSMYDVGYLGPPYCRATVTSAEVVVIPDAWHGRVVDFCAEGSDVWIRFGDSGVSVNRTATGGASSPVVLAENASPGTTPHLHIPAGTTRPVFIRKGATMTAAGEVTQTHFAHISANTTGFLRMTDSTGNGGSSP